MTRARDDDGWAFKSCWPSPTYSVRGASPNDDDAEDSRGNLEEKKIRLRGAYVNFAASCCCQVQAPNKLRHKDSKIERYILHFYVHRASRSPETVSQSVKSVSGSSSSIRRGTRRRRAGNNNVTASKMVNNDAGGAMPSTFLCVRKLGVRCRC